MRRGALFIGILLVVGSAYADGVAGTVKTATGLAHVIRGGQSIKVAVGTEVLAGDVVRTENGASVGVSMKDDSRVTVGPNSQVNIDQFAFNANTHEGGMLVRVFKGTAAFVSGLLVKANPDSVKIKTPTMTMGIRGTEFVVEVP
jgi:hypothetical protein